MLRVLAIPVCGHVGLPRLTLALDHLGCRGWRPYLPRLFFAPSPDRVGGFEGNLGRLTCGPRVHRPLRSRDKAARPRVICSCSPLAAHRTALYRTLRCLTGCPMDPVWGF